MSIGITILNSSKRFDPFLSLIDDICKVTLEKIETFFSLPILDITISPCPSEYKTKAGIVGCVHTPYHIDIMIDTERQDIIEIITNELPSVIAHELHHALRAVSGTAEETLLQVIVSEGLACHFETNFNGNKLPSFLDDISKYSWQDLYVKMKPQLNETNFDYPKYFGGNGNSIFPNRAGYWVGYNLVCEYINKYGGCSVALVDVPAEQIQYRQT